MNILFWKTNKQIDEFSNRLATELYSSVQPDEIRRFFDSASKKKARKDKSLKRIDTELSSTLNQLRQFQLTHGLGVYGKARLLLQFNDRLQELGYDQQSIASLKELILIRSPG